MIISIFVAVLIDHRLAFWLIVMPVQAVIDLLLVMQSTVMRRSGKFVGRVIATFATLVFDWVIVAVCPFWQ